ncbi:MAG: cytochrome P460 family protein [Acidobacteriota bacterium]
MSGRVLMSAAATVLTVAMVSAMGTGDVAYPADYRAWQHVKSTLVGPMSKGFAGNGGLHHFYANPAGIVGYHTGTFADGTMLIDDLVDFTADDAGVSHEGTRRRVAVMVKDRKRFADTGGWGFEIFKGDGRDPSLTAAGRDACYACHTTAGATAVFTKYRP